MNTENKILVGKIVAPQGIRGEFRVQSFADKPTDFKNFHIICDKCESNTFHFIRVLKQNVVIARIDDITTRNAAEELRGTELFIKREDLPNIADNEFYQTDLVGMQVVQNNTVLGVVDCFHNFGAGDIIELDNGKMVSFRGADVDFKQKKILIKG